MGTTTIKLVILVAITTFMAAADHITSKSYSVKEMTSNQGIYYEKVDHVMMKKADWQIIIYLDVDKFLITRRPREQKEILNLNCSHEMDPDQCKLLLGTDIYDVKKKTLDHLRKRIEEVVGSIGGTSLPTVRDPRSIRAKRMPVLGGIGLLSKSLFGLVTEDDAMLINRNIERLFTDQKTMSKLIQDRTHIISSGISRLYNITDAHDIIIRNLEEALRTKLDHFSLQENRLGYALKLNAYGQHMEAKLDHEIRSAEKLLEILHALEERKIHPDLLTL